MVAPLSAGQLDKRVTLSEKSVSAAPNGEEVVTWNDVATVWARVVDLRGRKFFAADKTQITVDIEVRIRHLVGITAEMRLTYGSEPYDIVEVITADASDNHLQMVCVKGVRDGR